ncbi:Maf family protein [Thiomicrospira sp. R3]|uniref:Maf family protein n=1 Tax=Thiomicrospira sp. R3 TaxID=3035472 RepID=UPI00259BCD34|nr:Maf family protein [Thiomicrospira sp. R3]WFE68723.1 Maf family protein [Thiomicrospira sp. R3]
MSKKLYLASSSPRRAELLSQMGLSFQLVKGDVEETRRKNESAEDFVVRMALEKAQAGLRTLNNSAAWIIGGDTLLLIDNRVIGKPSSKQNFIETMHKLSGTWHEVLSAVALVNQSLALAQLNRTRVKFKQLSEEDIAHYWATGEPCDKAGGYAIQGLGAKYVESIEGSFSAVMGLPIFELEQLLNQSSFYE